MLYIKLNDILRQLKEFFAKVPEIHEVYLFGSVAREDHLPWSDIDLLILSEDPNTVRKITSPYLDELFTSESILINAIFDNINQLSIIALQFKSEGKLIWARTQNSGKN